MDSWYRRLCPARVSRPPIQIFGPNLKQDSKRKSFWGADGRPARSCLYFSIRRGGILRFPSYRYSQFEPPDSRLLQRTSTLVAFSHTHNGHHVRFKGSQRRRNRRPQGGVLHVRYQWRWWVDRNRMKRKRKREEVFWVTWLPLGIPVGWNAPLAPVVLLVAGLQLKRQGRGILTKIEACGCKSSIHHSNNVNHELLIELVDDVSRLGCA